MILDSQINKLRVSLIEEFAHYIADIIDWDRSCPMSSFISVSSLALSHEESEPALPSACDRVVPSSFVQVNKTPDLLLFCFVFLFLSPRASKWNIRV